MESERSLLERWLNPQLLLPVIAGAVVMATGEKPFSADRTAWGLTVMGLGATARSAAVANELAHKSEADAGYQRGFNTLNPALKRPTSTRSRKS